MSPWPGQNHSCRALAKLEPAIAFVLEHFAFKVAICDIIEILSGILSRLQRYIALCLYFADAFRYVCRGYLALQWNGTSACVSLSLECLFVR
jgi:hypothetical protein